VNKILAERYRLRRHLFHQLHIIERPGHDVTDAIFGVRVCLRMVRLLGNLEPFKRSVFFRVRGLFKEKTRSSSREVKNILPRRSGYELRSGSYYSLGLSFYRESGAERIEGAQLKPKLDQTHFAYDPGPITVQFRYDAYDLDLVTKPVSREILTLLQIELDQSNERQLEENKDVSEEQVSAPQPAFVLNLKPPRYQYLGFLLFLVGSLMTSAASLAPSPWQGILTIVGPALTTLVLVALYRSLK
jgi:hypothetical protein